MHKFIRDKDLSHSEFGQWVHDRLPRTFFFADVDGIVYKKSTKILRIIEQKQPGQELKPSQKCILPLLAEGVKHLIEMGEVNKCSGVFVIFTESPFEAGKVVQIGGEFIAELKGANFLRFIMGDHLLPTKEH